MIVIQIFTVRNAMDILDENNKGTIFKSLLIAFFNIFDIHQCVGYFRRDIMNILIIIINTLSEA